MKVIKGMMVAAVAAVLLGGCTWVEISAQGEKVRVLKAAEVSGCERLGKTTVRTASKVAGLARYDEKIQAELETLARNSAPEIGGDTVVPLGAPENGEQVYEVYRCMPSAGAGEATQ
jgi:hypothetical protein